MIVKYLKPSEEFHYHKAACSAFLISDNGFNLGQACCHSEFYNLDGELVFNWTNNYINLYPIHTHIQNHLTLCKILILHHQGWDWSNNNFCVKAL